MSAAVFTKKCSGSLGKTIWRCTTFL